MIALTSCQHFPYNGQDLLWCFHSLYSMLLLSHVLFLMLSLCRGLRMSPQIRISYSWDIHCLLSYYFLLASSERTQVLYPIVDHGRQRCLNYPRNPVTQNHRRLLSHFHLLLIVAFHFLLLSAFFLCTAWTRLGDISNQHLYHQAATGLFASLQPSVTLHCLSILKAHCLGLCSLQTDLSTVYTSLVSDDCHSRPQIKFAETFIPLILQNEPSWVSSRKIIPQSVNQLHAWKVVLLSCCSDPA